MILNNVNSKEVINALESNVQGRFSYFQNQLKNMEVIVRDSLILINGNEMTDMFNIIYCCGNINKSQVSSAINYFRQRNLPFAWWVGFEGEPDNLSIFLEEHGLKRSEEELAMAVELTSSVTVDLPLNLTIKRVHDNQTMSDFIHVIADIIPNEADAINNFYQKAESVIFSDKPSIEFYVGYIDSQPISTCSIFFSNNIAGIFDIIASPNVRGMGIGSTMTKMGMKAAMNKGYKVCILTATDNAKFLYEKLEFKSLKSMCVYS